jgi:hypothetical protein
MKIELNNIWRSPTYLPYLQPKLSDEVLNKAEEKLGYKLPLKLVELLKIQNGGYISLSLLESPHNTIAGIGPHFPSLTDFDFEEVQEYVDFPLKGLVPFDGDGHWHLCLDYRTNESSPSITFIDVECNEQEAIASSFSEYLNLLQVDIGDEWVIEDVQSIDAVINELSVLLNCTFPAPDSWAHGYPTYRADMNDGSGPEWLWVSPNDVPSGFIREDDSRYDELKGLMQGTKKQYHQLPNNCYLLSFTDGISKRVLKALSSFSLKVRELNIYYK